jgi:hypothetical protein
MYTYTRALVYIHARNSACVFPYIWTSLHMYVCIHICISIEREKCAPGRTMVIDVTTVNNNIQLVAFEQTHVCQQCDTHRYKFARLSSHCILRVARCKHEHVTEDMAQTVTDQLEHCMRQTNDENNVSHNTKTQHNNKFPISCRCTYTDTWLQSYMQRLKHTQPNQNKYILYFAAWRYRWSDANKKHT